MKKRVKRYLAAALAVIMLLTDSMSGFATETDSDISEGVQQELLENSELIESEEIDESVVTENEETQQVLFEMEEYREQTEKRYRLSDGSIFAAQYGMDIHYESEEGIWEEIDNRFLYEAAETTDDFNGYRSAEGTVEFKFVPQIQEGEIVKITQDDYSVGFQMVTASEEQTGGMDSRIKTEEVTADPEGVFIEFLKGEVLNAEEVPAELAAVPVAMSVEEDEVTWIDVDIPTSQEDTDLLAGAKADIAVSSVGYANVFPGVSLQYVLAGSSLKEYILVNEKSDSYSYDFVMHLKNLKPQMQDDGSILLNNQENGTAVYEIPAGYMTDAAAVYSDAIDMSITEIGEGNWLLNITADEEWINAEERVFPVQIDPTLNKLQTSLDNIRGCYVDENDPKSEFENGGLLEVGVDSGGNETRSYIQFRNLPILPANSVICSAASYLRMVSYSNAELPNLSINVKEIPGNVSWDHKFTWKSQPSSSNVVMDYQNIGVNDNETYRSWNITELIKNHYRKGNVNGQVSTFVLEAYDAENMHTYYRAKSQMFLKNSLGYPILQIIYRDTKGVEEYFTYQTHVVGNAGIAYVGDYNGQLIVIKSVADYESTLMSYGLNLVYNSAYHDQYFTDNGLLIHSKDFSKMRTGVGWKLSAQETIVEVSIDSVDQWGHEVTSNWLVYNDSDGTEHYFWRSSSNASVYEDEDGLNLTITKSGSDFTMKDKQDNEKFFKNGYLTKLTDAYGNKIHIVYNKGNPDANVPTSSGTNKITAIYTQPNGQDSTKIFRFTYDANGFLTNIQETYSSATDDQRKSFQIAYETKNGKVYLKQIKNMIGAQQAESARYDYTNSICSLDRMTDSESGVGICYTYNKSMTGHRIGSYYMYSGDGDARSTGSTVTVSSDEHRKTIYRDSGADKTKNTADDIVITYLFNQCGQTINVSSRDQGGTLLGVTSSAYTSNSGTSRKNNRLTQSVSTGQSGANLLRNGGFENSITGDDGIPAASGWSKTTKSGSAARRDAVPHSGKGHYNLYSESAEGRQMIIQTVKLKGGSTYTASAYVKLPQIENVVAGKGVYLEIHDAAGNLKAKGDVLSYPANENIDGGFQRINLSYQAPSDATYKICIVWDGVQGTVRVDDVQMELAETPSSFSHVSNGSFENGYTDWSRDCIELTTEEEASETQKTIYGSGAFATKGEPGRAAYIAQTIMLNKSSDTTFMLSGWSKAYSIASVQKIIDSTNNGTGKKFWGISLMFTYSDNQTETHFLPFSEYIREWQYASMAVVPKRPGEIITTATVRCCYYNNATTARFDNISLTEEPAQTYVYNEKGSLVSVKSSGKGTEQYSYDTGTQNLIKIQTPGSGTYEYEYKTSGNKHLPVKVTNETVSMEVVYDSYGQATETTLSNTEDSTKMKSSAVYGDGLLISQKDNSGAETKYFYTEARDLCVAQNAKGEQIHTYQDLLWDRTDITYQKNLISVQYQYLNGNLLQINRGGYLKEKTESQENAAVAEKLEQIYGFTYDEFGNRTKAKISDKAGTKVWTLATYDYSDDFENMESMTYGPADEPLATIHYTYDKLDRVKSVTYDNNNEEDVTYGYKYSTDGSLSEITESGEKIYDYTYDSLGRLIYSTRFENGIPVLRTAHQYDTSDRITIQNWQIGNEEFSESYEYHSADGTLKSMATGGDALEFNYNHLKQLSKRTSPKLNMDYRYQTVTLDGEVYHTNHVSEIQYTTKGDNAGALPALRYSYDVLGNITEVDAGAENLISYEYDKQNQLTSAITPDSNFTYVYDTYGNILSKTEEDLNSAQTETYTYTYGDEGWKDLLTAVTYKTFDGVETTHELEYDAVGNPVKYFNGKQIWEFAWTNGRQLATAETTIDGQKLFFFYRNPFICINYLAGKSCGRYFWNLSKSYSSSRND